MSVFKGFLFLTFVSLILQIYYKAIYEEIIRFSVLN